MPPTLIDYSQLSKTWKIAAGSFLTLLAVGGTVLTIRTQNSSGSTTRQEYSDGRSAQSGALTVGSGSQKNTLHNDGRTTFNNVTYRFPYTDGSATGKVLKTNGAGQLSWSADLNTGGGGSASVDTGAILASGNSRWVNVSGDTMTGALSITGAGLNVSGLATTNRNISLQSGGLSRWTIRVDNAQNYKLVRHDGAGTALDSPFEINPTTGFVQIGDVAKAPTVQLEVTGTASGSNQTVTALKSCDTIDTNTAGVLACGTDNTGTDSADDLSDNTTSDLAEGTNLYYTTTRADGRFVNTSGDTMTGALLVKAAISGATLRIDNLKGCDTIDTSVAGVLSCGTDNTGTDSADDLSDNTTADLAENTNLYYTDERAQDSVGGSLADTSTIDLAYNDGGNAITATVTAGFLASGTGAIKNYLHTLNESRYVNTAGDTMTGTLTIRGTMTGWHLYAGTLSGAGLVDCDTAGTSKLLWDVTSRTFSCGADTDTNTTYTAAQGLTLLGTSFRLNDTISGSLVRFRTLSGSDVFGKTSLRSSGSLTWETAASGATLYIGGTLEGAGLTDCDADNQTVSWDATTKKFGCGDDDTSASGFDFATADARYVKKQGDTMSGALVILMTGGNNNTVSFETPHTMSGRILHAQDLLRSSGSLAVKGSVRFNNTGFVYDAVSNTVGIGANPDPAYGLTVDSGYLGVTGGGIEVLGGYGYFAEDLEVIGTASGSAVHAQNLLTSSGGAVIEGATLIGGTLTAGDFVCVSAGCISATELGTDSVASDEIAADQVGASEVANDALDFAEFSDTPSLDASTTISLGNSLLTLNLNSAGDFLIQDNGSTIISVTDLGLMTFNADGGDRDLVIRGDNDNSLFVTDASTDRVGVGTSTPETKLEVAGTMSGTSVVAQTGLSPAVAELVVYATGSTVGTGTGKLRFDIPRTHSGFILTEAYVKVDSAGTTGTMRIDLKNKTKGRNLFSVPLMLGSARTGSGTFFAGGGGTINAANDDVGGYDEIEVNIQNVHTTAAKGLRIMTTWRKP